jgi:hypothetical protein
MNENMEIKHKYNILCDKIIVLQENIEEKNRIIYNNEINKLKEQ